MTKHFFTLVFTCLGAIGIFAGNTGVNLNLTNHVFSKNRIVKSSYNDGIFTFQVFKSRNSKNTSVNDNKVQAWLKSNDKLSTGKYLLSFDVVSSHDGTVTACILAGKPFKNLSGKRVYLKAGNKESIELKFIISDKFIGKELRIPVIYLDKPEKGNSISISALKLVYLN